jgi:predicted metal-dependent peptidase
MEDKQTLQRLSVRLSRIREGICLSYPFFGRLLLGLRTGFDNCGTAYTDMRRVAFDPAFATRLSDEELTFVYLHELMHCVLRHCVRGEGKERLRYNIACDIVVNATILEMLGRKEMTVDGEEVIHRTPYGQEGVFYTAEEIYEMLRQKSDESVSSMLGRVPLDDHGIWGEIQNRQLLEDQWSQEIRVAASRQAGSGSGIPRNLRRHLANIAHHPTTNWRQLLHDHIQCSQSDYTYNTPDRRYTGDVIMPSFQENVYGNHLPGLWVLIDTSASVSREGLAVAFEEIRDALAQVDSFEGMLSFFDTAVTEPVSFETVEELEDMMPVGGGGTSFSAIFSFLKERMEEELPALILILTDGYAPFPKEEQALGVEVIWVIIDADAEPPWGTSVYVEA